MRPVLPVGRFYRPIGLVFLSLCGILPFGRVCVGFTYIIKPLFADNMLWGNFTQENNDISVL